MKIAKKNCYGGTCQSSVLYTLRKSRGFSLDTQKWPFRKWKYGRLAFYFLIGQPLWETTWERENWDDTNRSASETKGYTVLNANAKNYTSNYSKVKLACVINPLLFVTEGVFPFFFLSAYLHIADAFSKEAFRKLSVSLFNNHVLLQSFFLLNSAYVVLGSELVFFLFVPALFLQIQEFEKLRNQIAVT